MWHPISHLYQLSVMFPSYKILCNSVDSSISPQLEGGSCVILQFPLIPRLSSSTPRGVSHNTGRTGKILSEETLENTTFLGTSSCTVP